MPFFSLCLRVFTALIYPGRGYPTLLKEEAARVNKAARLFYIGALVWVVVSAAAAALIINHLG